MGRGREWQQAAREKNNMAGGSWPLGFLPTDEPERQHLIVKKPALLASYLFPLWLKTHNYWQPLDSELLSWWWQRWLCLWLKSKRGVRFYLPRKPALCEHSPNPALWLLPLKSSQMPSRWEDHHVRSPDWGGKKINFQLLYNSKDKLQVSNPEFHISFQY